MESWVVSSSWLLQVSCYKWRCCECWRLVDIGSFFLGIAGSEGCCVFNFIRNCQTVFHSCTIFYSPAMNEDSTCSISWKSASWVLNLSHSGGCEEASCGTFTLNCSLTSCDGHLFPCVLAVWYVLVWRIQVFHRLFFIGPTFFSLLLSCRVVCFWISFCLLIYASTLKPVPYYCRS